jgi:signal transduction histidine kinase/CheY-like chemotaxis protein
MHLRQLAASGDEGSEIARNPSFDSDDKARLERGLRNLGAHLMSGWDDVSDAVLMIDRDWRIVYANRCAHVRFALGEPAGQDLTGLVPGLAHPDVSSAVRDTQEFGRPNRVALELPGQAGRVELTTSQVPDGVVLILKAPSAGSSAAGPAESVAELRCSVSAFLAAINHEVRTPLNGILGYADLLLVDRHLNSLQREHVSRIRGAGSALLSVANDVLNYAVFNAAEVQPASDPFDLRETVRSVAALAKNLAEPKGVSFELHLDPRLPAAVIGDQDRFRQVLVNLVGNAVKFTAKGRIRVSVDQKDRTAEGIHLKVSVADTGIGIPQGVRADFLSGMRCVDPRIQMQFGGAGLGLPISRRIVESWGGTIGIESILDLGTTAWFTALLPIAQESARPVGRSGPQAQPRSARILLVEDNDINRDIARSMLEAAGHEVDVAADGSLAVMAVQSNTYHLVLMDVQMPIMDGICATRLIRSLPGPECDVPIIALTANVLPEQVQSFKAAGMNDFMGKPFRREELLSRVDRWAFDSINQVIQTLGVLKAVAGR